MTPSIRCESRWAGPGDAHLLYCAPNRPLDIGCLPDSNDESPTDVLDDRSHVAPASSELHMLGVSSVDDASGAFGSNVLAPVLVR